MANFTMNFVKNVKDTIHGYISLTPVEIFIIDSPIFQRLRGISQVPFGAMVYPSHSVKRFEHSIGTMHLAGRFIETVLLNTDDVIRKEYFNHFVKDMKKALNDNVDTKGAIAFLRETPIYSMLNSDSNAITCTLENKESFDSLKNIIVQLTRIMGLLHDIGHLPFSHLGEEIVDAILFSDTENNEKENLIKNIALSTVF